MTPQELQQQSAQAMQQALQQKALQQQQQQQQQSVQMGISGALSSMGLNFDTNGDWSSRFWNMWVRMAATAQQNLQDIPVTIFSTPGVVGAAIAIKPERDYRDVEVEIHALLSTVSMVHFVAPIKHGEVAFVRAEVTWTDPIPMPTSLVLALWQAPAVAWLAIHRSYPGLFSAVEAPGVPGVMAMFLHPGDISPAPTPPSSTP